MCTTPDNQYFPLVARDPAGGVFVVWGDNRFIPSTTGEFNIFGSHLSISGALTPGWTPDGDFLSGNAGVNGHAMADGAGGLYLSYCGLGQGFEVMAQHRGATHTALPGWPSVGTTLASGPGDQDEPSLVPDDSGGVYVFWEDQAVHLTRGVRLHSDGTLAAGWPQGGRLLTTPGALAGGMDVVSDGSGGVYALWFEIRPPLTDPRPYIFRITPDGGIAPGWPASGVPLTQIHPYLTSPHLAPDGAGGVYCGWNDFRSAPPGADPDNDPGYWDIYAQHILGSGALAPGWPADGLPICLAPRLQQGPLIIADGFGGAIFEWVDYRDLYEAVYAVRINPDGSRAGGWPANGTQVVVTTTYSYPQGMATDGVGGAYFGIQNDTQERCYVQHLRGDGSADPLYGPQGRAVVDVAGIQKDISIAADGTGGVYAAWDDSRTGVGAGIWAQHFGADGPTATLAALVESHETPNSVHLVWQGVGLGKGTVERRIAGGAWESLAEVTANGTGRLTFDDPHVEPGARYAYRLFYLDGAQQITTTESWIDVPLAYVLSLAGLTPNPATSRDLNVAFTLARQGPGALLVYDVSGREIAREDVSALQAGPHTFAIGRGSQIPPGVYWLRLTHEGRSLTRRGVVLR